MQYGEEWVPIAAKFTPLFCNAAVAVGASSINHASPSALLIGMFTGVISGVWGFLSAHSAHMQKNKELSNRNIGLTKGSELVKQAQKKAYAVPVLLGLAFSAAAGYTLGLVDSDFLKNPCVNNSEKACVHNFKQSQPSSPAPAVS